MLSRNKDYFFRFLLPSEAISEIDSLRLIGTKMAKNDQNIIQRNIDPTLLLFHNISFLVNDNGTNFLEGKKFSTGESESSKLHLKENCM